MCSVDIKGTTLDKDYTRLDEEFIRIHNQDFEQTVDIDMTLGSINYGKGHLEKMKHGIIKYDCRDMSPHAILYDIPCHCDSEHTKQTQLDILKAASNLGIVIVTKMSWMSW